MTDAGLRETASGSRAKRWIPTLLVGLATVLLVVVVWLGGDEAAGEPPMSGFALGLGLAMLLCTD